MQTWESFTNRHPRLRLSSYLRRKGVRTFDEAVAYFNALGIEPCKKTLHTVYDSRTDTNSRRAARDAATGDTDESTVSLAEVIADTMLPETSEPAEDEQDAQTQPQRTSRSRKRNTTGDV